MNINKQKELVQSTPGLAVQIIVQRKKYQFKHDDKSTKKTYSLGGLYTDVEDTTNQSGTRNTISGVRENVWLLNPDPTERDNFGNTLMVLPKILESKGFVVLDDKLQAFHKAAKAVKQQLAKQAVGGIIPASTMAKAEEYMEQYNLDGYTVRVIAIRTDLTQLKGSRVRSDGLYEARKTLRTVYIDRIMSEEELNDLLKLLADSTTNPLTEGSRSAEAFAIRNKGDRLIFEPVSVRVTRFNGKEIVNAPRSAPPGVKAMKTSMFSGRDSSISLSINDTD